MADARAVLIVALLACGSAATILAMLYTGWTASAVNGAELRQLYKVVLLGGVMGIVAAVGLSALWLDGGPWAQCGGSRSRRA